jgi:hypothetical protein
LTFVVPFFDFRPVPRTDGIKWVTIKVDEGAAEGGPWTEIDSFNISTQLGGLDADASHPSARSFTTHNATLENGWYRVRFVDSNGNVMGVEPIHNTAPDPAEYLPSLSDVGLVTLGRTVDSVNNITGTFSRDTQPDDASVSRLILAAGDDVRRKIGTDIPDDLVDDARRVVAVRTAMLIELSMFPSEVASDRSPYPQLKALYEELILDLSDSVSAEEAGMSAENVVDGNFPAYSFTVLEGFMEKKM